MHMPSCRALALVVALTASAHAADPERWELVWSDEFETPGLPDATKWDYEVGRVRNNEAQYYTKARTENARVEDGHLVIESRKEAFEGAEYTSASLITLGKAAWTRGRFEARAKLPKGRGVWPAIWTLGTNIKDAGWPLCGEIDIMEFVGHTPGIIHGTVHTDAYNHTKHTQKGAKLTVADPHDTWHVYAMDWEAKRLRITVDDIGYFHFDDEGSGAAAWPFDQPQYLLMNLAIGGAWGGAEGIDDGIFPQRMTVDWVRVYREKEGK
jgi:beta-glucanase (GH16 family)